VVDDPSNPRQVLARSDIGYSFAGSRLRSEFFGRGLALLRQRGDVLLIGRTGGPPALHDASEKKIARVEFLAQANEPEPQLPAGMSFSRIDVSLLDQCGWKSRVLQAYGTPERFLAQTANWCVLDDEGRVACEGYGAFRGQRDVEQGVVTAQEHRGKGLGLAACAKLIGELRQAGHESYWSCNATNVASLRLAERLGFSNRREYFLSNYSSS
jgi:GNAT superfamily N-acetyltransferase